MVDGQGSTDTVAIQIVLADSQAVYRVGIGQILMLENDIRVIAQVDTMAGAHSAVDRLFTHSPMPHLSASAIILLEGNMLSGQVDDISELVRRTPQLKIIVQFAQADGPKTVELYRRGVRGVIPRSISPELLIKCVRKVAAGETWIDNPSVNWVIEAYRSQANPQIIPQDQPGLSPREVSIIACITQGQRNKEIAHDLGTTEQVIKNYLTKLYDKLGVSDRLELAFYGLRHQLHKKASGTGSRTGTPIAERVINSSNLNPTFIDPPFGHRKSPPVRVMSTGDRLENG